MYRALLDIAQFGNTELPAKDLSVAVENLKARQTDSKEQCKLEIEFEVSSCKMYVITMLTHLIENRESNQLRTSQTKHVRLAMAKRIVPKIVVNL